MAMKNPFHGMACPWQGSDESEHGFKNLGLGFTVFHVSYPGAPCFGWCPYQTYVAFLPGSLAEAHHTVLRPAGFFGTIVMVEIKMSVSKNDQQNEMHQVYLHFPIVTSQFCFFQWQ